MNFSKIQHEFECTKSCHSRQHGSRLTSSLTKRCITDSELASFFYSTCQNFLYAIDNEGRSIFHVIASRGQRALLEWLLQFFAVNRQLGIFTLEIKDIESGYTSLHRSIFYGHIHIAVALIKFGVDTSILDNENMSAIDLALSDRHPRVEISDQYPCEVYVWGANTNYTLGVNNQQQRNNPELLNVFAKKGVFIKQVCLNKFHSIFVSTTGEVWSCGHGEGGRLGVTTDTRVTPTSISLLDACTQAATGRDHTLLLLNSGTILSCGLNEYHQLGQVPPPKFQLSPQPVKLRLSGTRGICAARYHSVAYNLKALYTWGLNGGQLGHLDDGAKTILVPKKVSGIVNDDSTIDNVAVSDGATVVTTSKGDIYVIYQYQCRKIAHRFHNIKNIQVVGGEVKGGDKLTANQKLLSILMLNTVGDIYLWQENESQFTRCVLGLNKPVFVKEAVLTRELVFITTQIGEAYCGTIIQKKVPYNKTKFVNDAYSTVHREKYSKYSHQHIDKDDYYLIKMKKIQNIYRAVNIFCDPKANNFAVLQIVPNAFSLDLPQVNSSSMKSDFLNLLNESSETDFLHDAVLKIENHTYPVHRFILSSKSEYFANLFCIQNNKEEKPIINIESINPIIFKQLLMFIYTETCDLLHPGLCTVKITNNNNVSNNLTITELDEISETRSKEKPESRNKKNKKILGSHEDNSLLCDPVRLLQYAAKKFGVISLYKLLDRYIWHNDFITIKKDMTKYETVVSGFDRNAFPHLWDICIKCSNGAIIKAHRCVLAARLEYFNAMFSHSWTENSSECVVSLPISQKLFHPVITFLYTDTCPELKNCEDFEFLGNMLVICDQFFISRVKDMCEISLSSMITLKNVCDILQLSDVYNCLQLKKFCMEYISLNLSCFLENRLLENISPRLLEELSSYYIEFNPIMNQRVITPFSNAPDDNIIKSCSKNFPVNIDEDIDDDILKATNKENVSCTTKKKPKSRKTSCSSENEKILRNTEIVNKINQNQTQIDITSNQDVNKELFSDDWIKVNNNQKQNKSMQAHLNVLSYLKDNKLPESKLEFVNIRKYSEKSRTDESNRLPDISTYNKKSGANDNSLVDDFQASNIDSEKTQQISLNITVIKHKLSQRQRKRLLSDTKQTLHSDEILHNNDDRVTSPTNQTSYKNPWKIIEAPTNSSVNTEQARFSDILEDQKKEKENLSRIMTKSLLLTQMEDKAIEELEKFYGSIVDDSEQITVKRVQCTRCAAPQWINKSPKTDRVA